MSIPRISILMPVRNEERWLPAALASLARQTLKDWELVAVDDGSSDRTPELLAAAQASDRRIRVLSCPAEGLVAALNAGLAACRAPLLARMDGDDVCHPRRLELQAAYLDRRPETGLVACRVRHFPRPQLTDGLRAYEEWQNRLVDHAEIVRDLFVESPFAHPSVMLRTAVLQNAGGYQDHGWAEDYDLWLRLAATGVRFARLPETLLFWRDRPERFSRTAPECSLEAFRACKLHYLRQKYLAGVETVTLWGAGLEGKAWRRILAAQGIAVGLWIEVDPRKIGQTIHDAPVVGLDRLAGHAGKILVTIGAKGARAQARGYAAAQGLVEGEDFLCVT